MACQRQRRLAVNILNMRQRVWCITKYSTQIPYKWKTVGQKTHINNFEMWRSDHRSSSQSTTMPAPSKFLEYINNNADSFIQRLADAVAIPRLRQSVHPLTKPNPVHLAA